MVTESQLAELYPQLKFTGTEFDFTMQQDAFAVHVHGPHTEEELKCVLQDLKEAHKVFDDFKALSGRVNDMLEETVTEFEDNKARQTLRWELMRLYAKEATCS
jgi:hypothetical protein